MIALLSQRYGADDLTEIDDLHTAKCSASYLVDYNQAIPIAIYDDTTNTIYLMKDQVFTKAEALKKARI